MSNHRLAAPDPGSGGTSQRPGTARFRTRLRKGVFATLAGVLTLGLSLGAPLAAQADIGGGGVGGGGGTGPAASDFWLFTGDNFNGTGTPPQGWGTASIDYFAAAMTNNAVWPNNDSSSLYSACTDALNQAVARGGPGSQARVVQVGTGVGISPDTGQNVLAWGGDSAAMRTWYDGLTAQNYWQPDLVGFSGSLLQNVHDTFMANISPSNARIVCIALNQTEGAPQNYSMTFSTDKSGAFATAGSSAAVSDSINASANGSAIRENVNADVTLNWGGVEGNPRSVSKSVSIANQGTTVSPSFTPADFGWSSWPSGNFWFDVSVAQQGKMANALSHGGQSDPRESWKAATTAPTKVLTSGSPAAPLGNSDVLASGQFYNAEISARTNGYASSMTITDSLHNDNVWIGSSTADDSSKAYIADPNGNKVAGASIAITRSGGTVSVSGTVTNIPNVFQARQYKLVVPTYVQPTKFDYAITDDSSVCYTAAKSNCIAGNTAQTHKVTPAPDKVWVLDQNGALTTADPGKSNQAGADMKTFAPGATIGAVVNGSVPANLAQALSSYTITDDWTGAAKYIDFTDPSKAKVFLNGADVTNQFTVTVSGTTTVATANAAFLAATKGLAQARTVKLFIGGAFRTDYDTAGALQKLTNSGSEQWNNEAVQTNTPAIYTVTPNPDKVWVLDENGALGSFDPNHTNTAGVDNKTFAPGAGISAVVNGSVPANLGSALGSYAIADDWTGAAGYVDFSDASKAKVFLDGTDVTNQFTVSVSGTTTVATAKAAFLTNTLGRATAGTVKLLVTGQFRNTYDTAGALAKLTNAGWEKWNNKQVGTNTPAIFTVTPTPDKVWVLDENGALSTSDKSWGNTAGSDAKVFLQNDAVAAVVNGSIPANLGSPLYNYMLIDDWANAAQYVDFSDASKVKVFFNGADVTNQFSVTVKNSKTVATANAVFLAATKGLAGTGAVKLVISGAFRNDYNTHGATVKITNTGSETWNNRTQPTNEPPVFVWTPAPNKQVLGSAEESGNLAHSDINGTSVWPGQKLEYSVGVDLRIPAGTARGVKTLAVEDAYDPYFVPDKPSVEFWDSRDPQNPRPVARAAYALTFDAAANTFTATFTQAWIDANVGVNGANSQWLSQGWLTMRFTGTVSKVVPAGATVVNQAFQIINGARTATEIPAVQIPTVTPDKESLDTALNSIDGKTVVTGDVVLYRLTLDGGPSRDKLAYNVHKLGIVDDFDDAYLKLDTADITVTEKATGTDVTGKFNVQVKDGIAYVFAKTVDTAGAYGDTIAGDPQPADLAAYDAATIKPLEDPIIDQALLGKAYWVTLKTTVTKADNSHVIENTAVQNIQNSHYTTRTVSNPLKDINPGKDVVVGEDTKDNSINQAEVKMYSTFNYRLNSSSIPGNRAYAATQWSISDKFDQVHDMYTGIWAIYANEDIYQGDTLIFKKGDLLADSAKHESEPWNDLFAVTFDDASYTFKVDATQKYLDLIGTRGDLANAYSVYTKMQRIAPSERVQNTATESYNSVSRDSNTAWTFTKENPGISVRQFTLSEGPMAGHRDNVLNAYEMTAEQLKMGTPPVAEVPAPEAPVSGAQAEASATEAPAAVAGGTAPAQDAPEVQTGVQVGIHVQNTGDVPLKNLKLANAVQKGFHGDVQDILCAVPADPTAPGAVMGTTAVVPDANGMIWVQAAAVTDLGYAKGLDCVGTLRGMEPGMTHGDQVTVTAQSVFTDQAVSASDSWFAKAASAPAIHIVKYTLSEGPTKGDRNTFKDALPLNAAQGRDGVQVGFNVTNTGNEPLTKLSFKDVTNDATTGTVQDIKLLTLATSGDKAAEVIKIDGKGYTAHPVSELTNLAIGQTVLLVGTLKGVTPGTGHADTATVTGVTAYSDSPVKDSDSWNAKLAKVPPAAPAAPPAAPPAPPVVPKGAITGSAVIRTDTAGMLFGGSAALMLAAGIVLYGIRRRVLDR